MAAVKPQQLSAGSLQKETNANQQTAIDELILLQIKSQLPYVNAYISRYSQ